jgi:thiamine-monophosphate kinase
MNIANIGEFGLIRKIKKIVGKPKNNVFLGIGDDAAAVKVRSQKSEVRSKYMLLTTDTLVENVHFDLRYSKFYELGWKLMAINISDVAAMGGMPKYALVTLGLKKNMKEKDILDLYRGMKAIANKFGVSVIGGDIVSSPKTLFFTLDMIGDCAKPVKRSGARAGDMILAFEKFGGSSAGLKELKKFGRKKMSQNAKSHLMPVPMVKNGLKASKYATAMIDNSDGLARCLIEICAASKVGAEIFEADIPLAKGATLNDALDGGEDYNLVLTASPSKVKLLKGAKVIGRVTRGKKIVLISGDGRKKMMARKGFEHF